LLVALERYQPGDSATITVLREGEQKDIQVTLQTPQ
jgi:S1-C subfamily serine protease